MKITERKYYTCEKCGRTSQNESKVKECEASHLTINSDAEIVVDYTRGAMCPDVLRIALSDGSIATYHFVRRDAAKEGWV